VHECRLQERQRGGREQRPADVGPASSDAGRGDPPTRRDPGERRLAAPVIARTATGGRGHRDNRTRAHPTSRTLWCDPRPGRVWHPVATHEYTTYDGISRTARRQALRRRRRLRLSLLLLVVLVPAVFATHALLTRGEVMPGTTVAGVDVGGLSKTAARDR